MADHAAGLSPFNWIDHPDAVLTADVASLQGPVINVQTYEAGVPWIALNLAGNDDGCRMTATFGKPREVGVLGFLISERRDDAADQDFEPYVAATDLVRWQLSSDPEAGVDDGDLWDSADHDDADGEGWLTCGVDPTLGVHGLLAPKTTGVRRVDFQFKFAAPPSAPFDVARFGRIWAGPWRQFETHHDWGDETGWDEDDLRHKVRIWSGPFDWIPEEVANADHIAYRELKTLSQQIGKDRQVFFWPRATTPSEAFFARFVAYSRFRSKFMTNMSTGNQGRAWATAPSLKEDWLGI